MYAVADIKISSLEYVIHRSLIELISPLTLKLTGHLVTLVQVLWNI
jgi:hypothetical protein